MFFGYSHRLNVARAGDNDRSVKKKLLVESEREKRLLFWSFGVELLCVRTQSKVNFDQILSLLISLNSHG